MGRRSLYVNNKSVKRNKYLTLTTSLLLFLALTLLLSSGAVGAWDWSDEVVRVEETFEVTAEKFWDYIEFNGKYLYLAGDNGVLVSKVDKNGRILLINSIKTVTNLVDFEAGSNSFAFINRGGYLVIVSADASKLVKVLRIAKSIGYGALAYYNGNYYVVMYDRSSNYGTIYVFSELGKSLGKIVFKPLYEPSKYLAIEVLGNYAYVATDSGNYLINVTVVDLKSGKVVGHLIKPPKKASPGRTLLFDKIDRVIDVRNPTKPFELGIYDTKGNALYGGVSAKLCTYFGNPSNTKYFIVGYKWFGVAENYGAFAAYLDHIAGPLLNLRVSKYPRLDVSSYYKVSSDVKEYAIPKGSYTDIAYLSNSLIALYTSKYGAIVTAELGKAPKNWNYKYVAYVKDFIPVGIGDVKTLINGYVALESGDVLVLAKLYNGKMYLVGIIDSSKYVKFNDRYFLPHARWIIPNALGKGTLAVISYDQACTMKEFGDTLFYEVTNCFKLNTKIFTVATDGERVYGLSTNNKEISVYSIDLRNGKVKLVKKLNLKNLRIEYLSMGRSPVGTSTYESQHPEILLVGNRILLQVHYRGSDNRRYAGILSIDLSGSKDYIMPLEAYIMDSLGNSNYIVVAAKYKGSYILSIIDAKEGKAKFAIKVSDLWGNKVLKVGQALRATEVSKGKYIIMATLRGEKGNYAVGFVPVSIVNNEVLVGIPTIINVKGTYPNHIALAKDTAVIHYGSLYIKAYKLKLGTEKVSKSVSTSSSTTKPVSTTTSTSQVTATSTVKSTTTKKVSTSTTITTKTTKSTSITSKTTTTTSATTSKQSNLAQVTSKAKEVASTVTKVASSAASKAVSAAKSILEKAKENPIIAIVALLVLVGIIVAIAKAVKK